MKALSKEPDRINPLPTKAKSNKYDEIKDFGHVDSGSQVEHTFISQMQRIAGERFEPTTTWLKWLVEADSKVIRCAGDSCPSLRPVLHMLKGISCPPLKFGWDRGIFADFDVACQPLIHHPARGTYNVWVVDLFRSCQSQEDCFRCFYPHNSKDSGFLK